MHIRLSPIYRHASMKAFECMSTAVLVHATIDDLGCVYICYLGSYSNCKAILFVMCIYIYSLTNKVC